MRQQILHSPRRLASGEPPEPNVPLTSEGKEVGYITRSAFSPELGAAIGMGYARREKAAPGSILECGDTKAIVIATPVPKIAVAP